MKATSHPRKLAAALFAAGLLLLPAGFFADSGRALIFEPEIEIAVMPIAGPAGSPVEVSGNFFPPSSPVDIGFSQDDIERIVGSANSDAGGNFTTTVAVPEDAALGPAAFFAQYAGGRAEAGFIVTGFEPIGDEPPAPPLETCTVTVTLVDMLVITDTGPHDDKWRIKSSSSNVGHDDTGDRPIGGDQGEVVLINRTVGTRTIPKTAFPKSEYLDALVFNVLTLINAFGGSLDTYELECPQNREEHVVVKGALKQAPPFEVVLKYRYTVTVD